MLTYHACHTERSRSVLDADAQDYACHLGILLNDISHLPAVLQPDLPPQMLFSFLKFRAYVVLRDADSQFSVPGKNAQMHGCHHPFYLVGFQSINVIVVEYPALKRCIIPDQPEFHTSANAILPIPLNLLQFAVIQW